MSWHASQVAVLPSAWTYTPVRTLNLPFLAELPLYIGARTLNSCPTAVLRHLQATGLPTSASAMPGPYINILLYLLNAPNDIVHYYHWALTVSNETEIPAGKIPILQIVNNDPISLKGRWEDDHRNSNPFESGRFRCIVQLPPLNLGAQATELVNYLKEFPSEQGETTTYHQTPWTCARWVIHVIQSMVDEEMFDDPRVAECLLDGDRFYQRVIALGRRYNPVTGPNVVIKLFD